MRTSITAQVLLASLLAGCASDAPVGGTAAAQPASRPRPAPGTPAPASAPAVRDAQSHRWELRAFNDNRIEIWCDGERVPDEHIVRQGNRVAVVDAAGVVLERMDMPASWTPAHGTPLPPGAYRATDGTALVPPASMLGGKLEEIPPSALAHMHAEHTAADGSKCAYVARVIPGLPMDAAGMKSHDVIVAVNGSPEASPDAIRAVVRAAKPGDSISFRIVRAGAVMDTKVTLAAWDPKHMAVPAGRPSTEMPATASAEPSAATQVAAAKAAADTAQASAVAAATAAAAASSGQGADQAAAVAAEATAQLSAARAQVEELKAQVAQLKSQAADSGAASAELASARSRVSELEAKAAAAEAAAASATAAAQAAAPAAAQPASDDLEAARKRIAELESQVRKEDAVHRAIRPKPAPQPSAGGAPPK